MTDEWQTWLLVGVVVGLALFGRYTHRRRFAARQAQQSELARSRGWWYQDQDPRLLEYWPGDPFGRDERKAASHVLRGTWKGRDFVAFDYSYEARIAGRIPLIRATNPDTRWGVVAMKLPVSLPPVQVEHESLIEGGDVRFESEDFNRRFRVSGPDGQYVRAVVTPRMMALLMDRGEVAWRICGGDLLAWDKGSADGEDLKRRLDLLIAVIEQIPNYVLADYGR